MFLIYLACVVVTESKKNKFKNQSRNFIENSLSHKSNSFQYEWLWTWTHFQKEVRSNLEMAYCIPVLRTLTEDACIITHEVSIHLCLHFGIWSGLQILNPFLTPKFWSLCWRMYHVNTSDRCTKMFTVIIIIIRTRETK